MKANLEQILAAADLLSGVKVTVLGFKKSGLERHRRSEDFNVITTDTPMTAASITTAAPTTTPIPTETKEAEIFYIVNVCTVFDYNSQAKDSADATSLINVLKVLKDHTDWPQASTLDDVAIESDFENEGDKACGQVDFTFTGKEEAEATDIINDDFFASIATLLEEALETKIEALASSGDGSVLPTTLALEDDDFSDPEILNENEEPEYDTETEVELEYSQTYEPEEGSTCDDPADIDLADAGLTDADEETLKCEASEGDDSAEMLSDTLSALADSGLDIEVLDSIAGLEEEPLFVQGSDPTDATTDAFSTPEVTTQATTSTTVTTDSVTTTEGPTTTAATTGATTMTTADPTTSKLVSSSQLTSRYKYSSISYMNLRSKYILISVYFHNTFYPTHFQAEVCMKT